MVPLQSSGVIIQDVFKYHHHNDKLYLMVERYGVIWKDIMLSTYLIFCCFYRAFIVRNVQT